jgi:fibronectin type 3 domain-containing protein
MSHQRAVLITPRVLATLACCLVLVGCFDEEDAANPPATAPATPANLAATGGNAAVALSWAASSGAARYHLKRSTTSGGPYSEIAVPISTSFNDLGLANGTAYFYVISASNSTGESGNSPQVSATPVAPVTIPATPGGFSATAGNGQVALNWNASTGATSYNVKRSLSSGGPYSPLLNVMSNAHIDTAVLNGNTYYYVVSAVNSAGESNNSSQSSATPVVPVSIPATPTGLTATAGNNQVSLSWAASNGAAGYRLKRAASSGGPYVQIATPTSTNYLDASAANGITYFYVVAATNTAGDSSDSSPASATPVAPIPAAPTGLAATAGNAQVVLNWNSSSGAAGYRVKRATTSGGPYTQIAAPTSTSYTDTAVINGTEYYYVVTAANAAGAESGLSAQANATPLPPLPATPTGLAATAGNAQVSLSWTASSGATGYRVKRGTSSGGPYNQIATPVTTSYTDSAVSNDTTYYYIVTAANPAGESGASTQASATPQPPVPAIPNALMAVSGNGQVGLSWLASSGATSYNVKRSTSNGGPYSQLANPTTNSYTDTAVLNGDTYYYVVSAVNSAGESGNTAQVTGTPTAPVTAPAAPTGLSATAGDTQVSLSWTASSGATSYHVMRATTDGGPYTEIAVPITTAYIDTSVTNDTTYYYVVRAANSAGQSGNSGQASATPTAPVTVPAAPAALSATPGNAQVALSWSASGGATSYRVKRSTTSGGPYTSVATPTSTTYTNTGLTNGTTYYYVVTAMNAAGESGNSPQASASPSGSSTVIFFDDFLGSSVDSTKWSVLNRLSDQVNGELDCVVPQNITVQGGILSGVSRHEDYTCGDSVEPQKLMHYTSWHIQQKTTPFLYGTVEARVKVPGGTGLWPLVWMLGFEWQASQPFTANTPGHQWPNAGWGEIDIVEFLSNQRRENNTVVHFNQPGGSWNGTLPFDANTRFMVYRLQWSASALTWSVDAEDGQGFRTLRTITDPARIPNVPMYVILSTAIGGVGGGSPDPSTFPQTYQADWVRVTQ